MRHLLILIACVNLVACSVEPSPDYSSFPPNEYLQISGIYPHMTAYNQPEDSLGKQQHRECGIGAVVPWAGRLWYITYPPHMRTGSNDKLYYIDPHLTQHIHPQSIGGTHANRMIHKESRQLIIGPHFIDSLGNVRTADVNQLEGRLTATTRHLSDPANKVYFYEMEGAVYEVDVHSLEVSKLFEKPVPGWHGKGAYVSQGKLVVANNGEHPGHPVGYEKLLAGGPANSYEEAGVLAAWDGSTWEIVERKKFTDVSGPGGLYGNENFHEPLWSMGWDKGSVILKLLEEDNWYTYRLPKASHTFDPRHGWFTEWPRIRKISLTDRLMVMHGTLFRFPLTFTRNNSGGIYPLGTHLRYIPDIAFWKDRVILAADDASTLQNPIVGQPQSNLWWGSMEELSQFGPANGWGGPWIMDRVNAGDISDPYLLKGYSNRVLHLKHDSNHEISLRLEIDSAGTGEWKTWKVLQLIPGAYHYEILPSDLTATWMRLIPNTHCLLTAYFHFQSPYPEEKSAVSMFEGLASTESDGTYYRALIRPAGHNRSLQVWSPDSDRYWEVELNSDTSGFAFQAFPSGGPGYRGQEVQKKAQLQTNPYEVDVASVFVYGPKGEKLRLPKSTFDYESVWSLGKPRALREVQSERYLANIHGMFYEVPRAEGAGNHVPDFQKMKPISRHDRKIVDYASWRGLLVMSGVEEKANSHPNLFTTQKGMGLWMGKTDDLWQFGKPTGVGGPWKNTQVKAGAASDPYLMTGFDNKRLDLSHEALAPVNFQVEVAINHHEWGEYAVFEVGVGEKFSHEFPKSYQAHWVRIRPNTDCTATATFIYE